jgi:hypothetical protein
MQLQPKSPAAKRAGAQEEARREAVAARFRAAVEDNGVRDHLAEICAQVAELEQLVADLPDPDERLTQLVGQLADSVAALAKIPWDTCR